MNSDMIIRWIAILCLLARLGQTCKLRNSPQRGESEQRIFDSLRHSRHLHV
jgi:hypothetical protein